MNGDIFLFRIKQKQDNKQIKDILFIKNYTINLVNTTFIYTYLMPTGFRKPKKVVIV